MKQDFGNFNGEEVHKYEKEYFDYQQTRMNLTFYGNWQRDFGKLIIELADLNSNIGKEWETVLDVGCAVGLHLRAIDELGLFSRLIGTDISNYLIDMIPSLHDFGSYGEFHATPSHDLSMIEDKDVDLLICTQTLEHVVTEELLHDTLKEFQRVLHHEGKIIITVPVMKIEPEDDPEHNALHMHIHTKKWWGKLFSKYFKSESFKANIIFKNSKLKPNRSGEKTFYEEYEYWSVFRLVNK